MARGIHLRPDVSVDELERRYRAAKEPHERSWWQILWLLARGQLAKDIAESTGYSRYWIGQIAKRFNTEGSEGMHNRQYAYSHRAAPLLAPEQFASLAAAVRSPAPEGDERTGRLVAVWMSHTLGRPVSPQVGWVYLVRLEGGASPAHAMCWPTPNSKPRSKKAEAARPGRRDRLPAGKRRALGRRRAPYWVEADSAQSLVLRRAATHRAGAAPLRLTVSRRLCPPSLGPYDLSFGHLGEHAALRSGSGRVRTPGRCQSPQANRPRLGSRGVACERQAARPRVPLAAHEHRTRQSALRQHRGTRRGTSRPLRRLADTF
jgi:hypothetical protein